MTHKQMSPTFTIPGTTIEISQACLNAFYAKYGSDFDDKGAMKWAYLEIFAHGWILGIESTTVAYVRSRTVSGR